MNILFGHKTKQLSGSYLYILKPFTVPGKTAAENLPQSDSPRILPKIKAKVPDVWERSCSIAPEALKDRSSEPFRHLTPLKSGRSEHFNNWGNLNNGTGFQ